LPYARFAIHLKKEPADGKLHPRLIRVLRGD